MNQFDPIRDFGVLDSNSIGYALFIATVAWAAVIGGIAFILTHFT